MVYRQGGGGVLYGINFDYLICQSMSKKIKIFQNPKKSNPNPYATTQK
jgi:hypothetical protein